MTISSSAPTSSSWASLITGPLFHQPPPDPPARPRTNSWAQIASSSSSPQTPSTQFNVQAAPFCPSSSSTLSIDSVAFVPPTRPRSVSTSGHPNWTVYTDCLASKNNPADQLAFEGRLALVGGFNSASEFEHRYANRLDKNTHGLAIRVFRQHIQPLWEDPQNSGQGAGKWVIQGASKAQMLSVFRGILRKMIEGQVPAINGAISVCKRGQHVVMLWTRAPASHELYYKDPFGIQQLVSDVGADVGAEILAGFKPHVKAGKKNAKKNWQSVDSDYELSPELHSASAGNFAEFVELGLTHAVKIVKEQSLQINTRPRALSWAEKARPVAT